MTLSPPTQIVFLLTIAAALLALLATTGTLSVLPVPPFWLMTAAYGVLAIACLVKKL